MSLESVRRHLSEAAPDLEVLETPESSATVELAAAAHGVEPAQIAKTLSFRLKDDVFLVVARGDGPVAPVETRSLRRTRRLCGDDDSVGLQAINTRDGDDD